MAILINAYITVRELPPLAFPHELENRRDWRDADLAGHLDGFIGFVMDRGRRPMTVVRYAVWRHIQRVRHHLSISIEPDQLDAFAGWAGEANALLFMTDATVRAPNGRVLVDPETGDGDPGAEIPYPEDARARKASTEVALSTLGVRVLPTLPPVISLAEVVLREPGDVARRLLATVHCALRAGALSGGGPDPASTLPHDSPLAYASLSPNERAFLAAATPAPQTIVDFTWRFEAAWTLAWALGLLAEMPFPSSQCDAVALADAVRGLDERVFVETAQLRDPKPLLDALDLTFRLRWAQAEARKTSAPPPAGIQPGVLMERHHALNWLVRFENADWDDVTTPS